MSLVDAAAKVWMDMDQAALDAAYDQAVWAPNQKLVHERRTALSGEAYARLKPRRIAYGASEIEALDFYSCGASGAPLMIFIHGGAWRSGRSSDFAHLADTFLGAGAHVAILDFINIDDAGGRLETMVGQVRSAVAFLAKNAASLGADPARVHVGGHSSGAHLTGCVLTTDWADYGLPQTALKGAVAICGMYDLEPVRRSARSTYVRFADETVEALSAMRRIDRILCPVILGYGTQESPEFQRQTRDFAAALEKAGKDVRLFVGAGCNHFEMLESLHNPHGVIGRAAVAMLRGG